MEPIISAMSVVWQNSQPSECTGGFARAGWIPIILLVLWQNIHPPVVQVALPELDGGMEPIVFAGRDGNTGKSHSLPDRIDSLCSRAIKWSM